MYLQVTTNGYQVFTHTHTMRSGSSLIVVYTVFKTVVTTPIVCYNAVINSGPCVSEAFKNAWTIKKKTPEKRSINACLLIENAG